MPFRNEHLVRDFYDYMTSNGFGVVAVWWCGEQDICGTPRSADKFVDDVYAADYCKVTFEWPGELTAGSSRWVMLTPYDSSGDIICDHSVHSFPKKLAEGVDRNSQFLDKEWKRFEETIAAWECKCQISGDHSPVPGRTS